MNAPTGSEGLWDWDLVTNRVHFSPRWMALVGAVDDEVSNSPDEWFQRVHPEDAAQVTREIEAVRNGREQAFAFRHRLRQRDGAYRWVTCRGTLLRDSSGRAVRLSGSHADARTDAIADPVTGLPNRVLLLERLTRALDRYSHYGNLPFAVLLVGLDRPTARQTPPNASSDSPLLNAVARRLERCLRLDQEAQTTSRDHLVARLDSDYFAVVLEGLNEIGDSKDAADQILAALQTPVALGNRHVYVTASIGIAVSVTGYASAEAMLRDTETALHRARVLGGSRSEVFDTGVLQAEQTALRLEHEMSGALERREFVLAYQPIVSLTSGRIVGFEALIRWRHPAAGLIAPTQFIPSAERTGFIVPLGAWVLRQACEQVKAWRGLGPDTADLWMSVNVSGVQLKRPTLVEELSTLLRESELDPRALVLELTEGVACEDPDATKTILMQLRALGVRISIDDFGTGYSSLAYLRLFPIDALKVDRSFVHNITIHPENAAIISSVTGMAKQLGLHVVAEGIERAEQVALLRTLQCDAGQGYLFARPVDAEAATDLLRTGGSLADAGDSERASEPPSRAARVPRAQFSSWTAVAVVVGTVMALAGVASWFSRESSAPAQLPPPVAVKSVDSSPIPAVDELVRPTPDKNAVINYPGVSTKLEERSFRAEHLHRFGSCHGRLTISRKGLLFTPSDKSGKDRVMLGHDEFITSLSPDTLTIKSNTRTYRFRVAEDVSNSRDAQIEHRALSAALNRLR